MGFNDRKLQEKDDKRRKNYETQYQQRGARERFIGFSPTKEEKAEAKKITAGKEFCWSSYLINALEMGYKLSVKWSDKGQAFSASLVGSDTSPNADMVLTAYHSDMDTAVAALIVAMREKHRPEERWSAYQTSFDNEW